MSWKKNLELLKTEKRPAGFPFSKKYVHCFEVIYFLKQGIYKMWGHVECFERSILYEEYKLQFSFKNAKLPKEFRTHFNLESLENTK